MFYAASTGGFYDAPENYPDFPADALEITDELYAEVFAGQAIGMLIVPDADGLPTAVDPPPPPPPTRAQIDALRLQAYANPLTGSDHFFAESVRLKAQGDPQGAAAAIAAGQARYDAIRAEYPWPTTTAKKAKQ